MDETVALPAATPPGPFDADELARSRGFDLAFVRAAARRLARGQWIISGTLAALVVGGSLFAFSPWWTTFYRADHLIAFLVLGGLRGVVAMFLTLQVAKFLFLAFLGRFRIVPSTVFPGVFALIVLLWQLLIPATDVILGFGLLSGVALGAYLFGLQEQYPARVFDAPIPNLDARLAAIGRIPAHQSVMTGRVRWLLFEHAAHTVSFVAAAYLITMGEWAAVVVLGMAMAAGLGRHWAARKRSLTWSVVVDTAEAVILTGVALYLVIQITVVIRSGVVSYA